MGFGVLAGYGEPKPRKQSNNSYAYCYSTRIDRITTNAYMIDKLVESLYMIFQ